MKRYKHVLFLALLLVLSAFFSCFPIDDVAEGIVDDPVEITTTAHRGFVGYGYRTVSYYTFLSTSDYPTIFYDHLSVAADLDCEVYTNPNFYNDQIAGSHLLSENHCVVSSYHCANIQLYVKIINYSNDEDVDFDIYFNPTN